MKIKLIAVGKVKEGYLREGLGEYEKRLKALGVSVEVVEVAEERGEGEKCSRLESEKLLAKVGEEFVAFDLTGEVVSSEEFAEVVRGFEKEGKMSLVIGGSHGLSDEVRKKAKRVISFGRVTYPHQLFRLLVLEQVYRALTILRGKEYHK